MAGEFATTRPGPPHWKGINSMACNDDSMMRGDGASSSSMTDLERLAEPRFDRRGNSNYTPAFPGLHLCGICQHPDGCGDVNGEQPYTALNLQAKDDAEARRMWEAAKAEGALDSRDGEDFLCDLNLSDGHVDDFSTNRQMIPRLIAAALAAKSREVG